MSALPIRKIGDPVLREKSRTVETFDDLLRRLRDDMLEAMYGAPGVGLAAPQIGLALSFFVYDPGDGSGPSAVANPVLSELDGELKQDEGCLSILGLWYPTPRALRVRLNGQDIYGRPISLVGEGLVARIFQHETDHLMGKLFIDRLDPEDRKRAMAELRERELGVRPGRVHTSRGGEG
jgi:peptide deformylase